MRNFALAFMPHLITEDKAYLFFYSERFFYDLD
ncbi:MAG: hypothetical protein HW406_2638 [Candidatus Brocadiaceae bacterium]|nr:hypothetical protein [Candidatus Brocadiaceae bacterium]